MLVYLSSDLVSLIDHSCSGVLRSCCLSFCSFLFQFSCRYDLSPDHGVYVSAVKARRIYTRRQYDLMIALLLQLGIIRQWGFKKYEHTKAYQLMPQYRDNMIRLVLMAPKLASRLAKETETMAPIMDVHQWLEHVYLKRCGLHPTVEDVLTNFPYESDYQWASYQYLYDRFVDKARLYDVADSGRVTYMPNLIPKPVRSLALIDGEPTVEVDVAASQPRAALTLFPKDSSETKRFLSLLDSGELYEVAAEWLDEIWDHDYAKQQFFKQVLYGNKRLHKHFKMWDAFSARFPELAAVIEQAKRDDMRVFPVKLQKIEADIMIHGVAAECAAKRLPVLAIHDGFATRLKDADAVVEMIDRHWTGITGYSPRIRVGGEFRR